MAKKRGVPRTTPARKVVTAIPAGLEDASPLHSNDGSVHSSNSSLEESSISSQSALERIEQVKAASRKHFESKNRQRQSTKESQKIDHLQNNEDIEKSTNDHEDNKKSNDANDDKSKKEAEEAPKNRKERRAEAKAAKSKSKEAPPRFVNNEHKYKRVRDMADLIKPRAEQAPDSSCNSNAAMQDAGREMVSELDDFDNDMITIADESNSVPSTQSSSTSSSIDISDKTPETVAYAATLPPKHGRTSGKAKGSNESGSADSIEACDLKGRVSKDQAKPSANANDATFEHLNEDLHPKVPILSADATSGSDLDRSANSPRRNVPSVPPRPSHQELQKILADQPAVQERVQKALDFSQSSNVNNVAAQPTNPPHELGEPKSKMATNAHLSSPSDAGLARSLDSIPGTWKGSAISLNEPPPSVPWLPCSTPGEIDANLAMKANLSASAFGSPTMSTASLHVQPASTPRDDDVQSITSETNVSSEPNAASFVHIEASHVSDGQNQQFALIDEDTAITKLPSLSDVEAVKQDNDQKLSLPPSISYPNNAPKPQCQNIAEAQTSDATLDVAPKTMPSEPTRPSTSKDGVISGKFVSHSSRSTPTKTLSSNGSKNENGASHSDMSPSRSFTGVGLSGMLARRTCLAQPTLSTLVPANSIYTQIGRRSPAISGSSCSSSPVHMNTATLQDKAATAPQQDFTSWYEAIDEVSESQSTSN